MAARRQRMRTKKPVICTECGIVLQYDYNLKRHWLNRHVPNELKCRPCKLHFPSVEEAEEHKETCAKAVKVKKELFFDGSSESEAPENMSIIVDHPLMKIRSLDAPAENATRRRRSARRRRKRLTPIPRTPQRTLKMVTRSHGKLAKNELKLSDSESSDDQEEKRQQSSDSSCEDDSSDVEESNILEDSSDVEESNILEDLNLSSDDESSQSGTSEITAPCASDDDEEPSSCNPAEPLTDRLPGSGYFWVQKAPGRSVIAIFRNTSISESPDVVIAQFKLLCRDLPIERACMMLTEKLKLLPIKRCIALLRVYYQQFKHLYVGIEISNSMEIFGRIVMTLVLHYYGKDHSEVAGQLLKFLNSKHVDPYVYPPIEMEEDLPLGQRIPKEADLVIMCCTIYVEIHEMESATKFLMRALTEFIQKSNTVALEALKPLLHRMVHNMIESHNNVQLVILFECIYQTQVGTTYPVDLSLFYDGVLSSLVSSSLQSEQNKAMDLFEDITRISLLDLRASEIPGRGLLAIAAEHNVPRAQMAKILMSCINKKAYPAYDFENFSVTLYSSMSKVEMQVYLEHFLFLCAAQVESGWLEVKPFLAFEVVVTSNTVRNYKYPVHRKILKVDHSYNAAMGRLSLVLRHCLSIPAQVPIHNVLKPYQGGKFIMLGTLVDVLFRHVLKVNTNCSYCYNCT